MRCKIIDLFEIEEFLSTDITGSPDCILTLRMPGINWKTAKIPLTGTWDVSVRFHNRELSMDDLLIDR
jgi:hypothetical protein